MPNKVPVEIKCSRCDVAPVTEDNPTDSSRLTCPKCGADLGTYGQFKSRAVGAVRDKALKRVRDAFKGFGKRR